MFPELNFLVIAGAALIPMVIGALFYGPVFGKQWMDSLGITEDDLKGGNMAVIYGLAILMAFIIAFFLKINIALTHKEVNDAGELIFGSFGTFKHGALHGLMTCLMCAGPVIVSLGLFQRNSAKNIILNVLYWSITFAIMGGVLDAFA